MPGDEVLAVTMGLPTTVTPIIHNGLKPVIVDVQLGTYDAKPERRAIAIGPKTHNVMMGHALDDTLNLDTIQVLRKEHAM